MSARRNLPTIPSCPPELKGQFDEVLAVLAQRDHPTANAIVSLISGRLAAPQDAAGAMPAHLANLAILAGFRSDDTPEAARVKAALERFAGLSVVAAVAGDGAEISGEMWRAVGAWEAREEARGGIVAARRQASGALAGNVRSASVRKQKSEDRAAELAKWAQAMPSNLSREAQIKLARKKMGEGAPSLPTARKMLRTRLRPVKT